MKLSPPIPVRIEWADSQGRVTASWLAAHFNFRGEIRSTMRPKRRQIDNSLTTGARKCPKMPWSAWKRPGEVHVSLHLVRPF